MQIAAEDFICRNDPVAYLPNDATGTTGGTNIFWANLVNVERDSTQSVIADFTATLTATTSNVTANTIVECSDRLSSSNIQRKTLIQSRKSYTWHEGEKIPGEVVVVG